MKQIKFQMLEKEIKNLIKKLESEISHMEEDTKPISPENSIGRLTRMDAINNKSVLEASLRSKRKKLTKLKVALSSIGKPGFGICISCKQPIDPRRLMLLPESDKCVKCA